MPELPEMEAWRRALDDPVSAFPIVKAGPAHIATLKTFDPPLSALEGRQLAGATRRAKRLLFPDRRRRACGARAPDDGRTVEVPQGGRDRPEDAGVPARLRRRRAARADRSRREEAGGCVVAHSGGSRARARPPRARGPGNRSRAARRDLCIRIEAVALDAPRPTRDRGNRASLGERDPASREALAVRADT